MAQAKKAGVFDKEKNVANQGDVDGISEEKSLLEKEKNAKLEVKYLKMRRLILTPN